jgi:hypothetical protein
MYTLAQTFSTISITESEEKDIWQLCYREVCYSGGAVVGAVIVGDVGIPSMS